MAPVGDEGVADDRLKGVVFDVDGTLLNSSHQVSPRMQAVCRDLVEKGVWLSIASARPPTSVQQLATIIGARGPLCALNGAVVLTQDGTIKRRLSIPASIAQDLIAQFMTDTQVSLNVYSGTEWIVPRIDARIEEEAEVVHFGPTVSPDMKGIGPIEKVLLLLPDARAAAALIQALLAEHSDVAIARSNPCYIEITPSGVDKAFGVAEAARLAGLSMSELAVCGDGENDVTMLKQAGYGIAMAHGPAELRSAARQIVGGNDDDSLPAALEALFRSFRAT